MKRFVVFAYDNYYPSGGWDDLSGVFDNREEAHKAAIDHVRLMDVAQVVDFTIGEVVMTVHQGSDGTPPKISY
jgi:hypothetical protein